MAYLLSLLLFVFVSTSSYAQEKGDIPLRAGWFLTWRNDAGTGVVLCLLTKRFPDVTIGIAHYQNGTWAIAFGKPDGFKPGLSWPMSLAIDGQQVHAGTAHVGSDGLGRLDNPLPLSAVAAISRGDWLTVTTSRGTFRYDLAGSTTAVNAAEACMKRLRSVPERRPSDFFLTREELLPIANRLLLGSGVVRYKYLQSPPEAARYAPELLWMTEDGTGGSLMASRPGVPITLQDAANVVIQRDSEDCKAEFFSGKKPARYVAGSSVQRVLTSCKDAKGAVLTEYSLVELPSGAIVRVMHMSAGQNADPERIDRIERETVLLAVGGP